MVPLAVKPPPSGTVDKHGVHMQAGEGVHEERGVGTRIDLEAEPGPNPPVPVRGRAVPETVPDTEQKPAERCEAEGDEVGEPCFAKYPPKEVE